MGVGPYGESKILAEKLCLEFMGKGLDITILRPKTFLGTGRLGVFEILFDWIHDGKRIPVIGNGQNLYQLLAVDDLVEVIRLCIQNSSKEYNDVFNVAAEAFGTVQEDLNALFEFAKSGSRVLPTPASLVKIVLRFFEILHLSPLYQWVYDTADKDSFVSIDKLKSTFHWSPRFSNAQILIKSYDWYLKNYTLIKSKQAGITHTAAWKQGLLGLVKKFM
jgi:nucleoside-diphosphate-sugar epimerase